MTAFLHTTEKPISENMGSRARSEINTETLCVIGALSHESLFDRLVCIFENDVETIRGNVYCMIKNAQMTKAYQQYVPTAQAGNTTHCDVQHTDQERYQHGEC